MGQRKIRGGIFQRNVAHGPRGADSVWAASTAAGEGARRAVVYVYEMGCRIRLASGHGLNRFAWIQAYAVLNTF